MNRRKADNIIIIASICLLSLGCSISYPTKYLHVKNKVISKKTKLVFSLEDQSDFNIEGENVSSDTLHVLNDAEKSLVLPQTKFTFKTNSSVELINKLDRDIKVNIRVNYNRTNLIQNVYAIKK